MTNFLQCLFNHCATVHVTIKIQKALKREKYYKKEKLYYLIN